jgi:hypothetical protein
MGTGNHFLDITLVELHFWLFLLLFLGTLIVISFSTFAAASFFGLLLGDDKEVAFFQQIVEILLGHLEVVICLLDGLIAENTSKEFEMMGEEARACELKHA